MERPSGQRKKRETKKWLTEEDFKNRDQRWKNGNNEMKEMKPDVDRKEDTKKMPRKEQMAISRLRTGYKRATHCPKMEEVSNLLCPFCNTYPSTKKKLRTREWAWTWKRNNGSTGKYNYAKEIGLKTEYRNGKNNWKVSKIISKRKRTNQSGDENEERRRKTNEDAHGL
jgi:hypothetical protein